MKTNQCQKPTTVAIPFRSTAILASRTKKVEKKIAVGSGLWIIAVSPKSLLVSRPRQLQQRQTTPAGVNHPGFFVAMFNIFGPPPKPRTPIQLAPQICRQHHAGNMVEFLAEAQKIKDLNAKHKRFVRWTKNLPT